MAKSDKNLTESHLESYVRTYVRMKRDENGAGILK